MPPTSYGRPGPQGRENFTNGSTHHGQPPPSTLAAQLVENISASTRSSRPDETAELSKLIGIIERVKDEPDNLKTQEERVGHNHMLIYVYARVTLEGLRWDDPFADTVHLRSEALGAINFLKVAVAETPEVLLATSDPGRFLFRGKEPLWIWIFPKVLKMLGYNSSVDLAAAIEPFFETVFSVACRSTALWPFIPQFLDYLKVNFTTICSRLVDIKASSANKDLSIGLRLPTDSFLEKIGSDDSQLLQHQCTYTLPLASQAFQHATGLLSIMTLPFARRVPGSHMSPFQEYIPSLLDAYLSLHEAQQQCRRLSPSCLPLLLQNTLQILGTVSNMSIANPLVQEKALIVLVIICVELSNHHTENIAEDQGGVDGPLLCKALVKIADASLEKQQVHDDAAIARNDLPKCLELLRRVTVDPAPTSLGSTLQPDKFATDDLRHQVKSLEIAAGGNAPNEPQLKQLDERGQCQIIDVLGYICCAADNTLVIADKKQANSPTLHCSRCYDVAGSRNNPLCLDPTIKKKALGSFSSLVQLPSFAASRRPRVTAMVALRRLAKHCCDPEFLNIETSVAAQWCWKSLQSSVRELRIASGRTLAVFLSEMSTDTSDTIYKNRTIVLKLLRSLSEQNQPHLTETCIMAWSQIGSVVTEDQLNLVLIKLVEYLGQASVITSATAFTEIMNLAQCRQITPRQLLEPFWRSLAFSAVKDCVTQPKLIRILAELMSMNIQDLILYIHGHAMPWLVLTKRRDVIQKIAEARGEQEPWQPCLDNANLGPILALLLVQEVSDVQEYSMTLLRQISSHFDGLSLVELLQMEPLITTLELLKAAGDADEIHKPHIRGALNQMALLILAAFGEAKQKKSHATGRFLQQHALGLMARLTDMSACLLAAMSDDELRSSAFSCWAAMLLHLEEEDVEVLIETTFFLISHYWTSFETATQDLSRHLIETLLNQERAILEDVISKLPSFSHINGLADVEAKLSTLRKPVDNRTAFFLLSERISHENAGVVLQALRELASYLQKQQGYLQASAVSEQPDSVVPTLARALLNCASKYNGVHEEISSLCTQCIGLMGCLDPNRVDTVRAERQIVVRSNFEESSESTDFVVFLLEEVLVKSFLSATDTKLQGYLSYVMQELLERCDIASAIKLAGTRDAEPIYRKWLSISEGAREVLTPFLSSRYVLAPMPQQPTEYPIFRPGKIYGNWIRTFTLDLLRRPQNGFASLIFEPLCRVIRVKDLSIAEFLLPYLVLHIVIGETTTGEVRNNVLHELLSVLQHELSQEANYAEKEDKKLYCEAVFRVLDYASRWIQAKKSQPNLSPRDVTAIQKAQDILDSIPAELISQRAVDCQAYSRALFHLEQHIRQVEGNNADVDEKDRLLQRLQDIYTQIDEPDGLEGISAHLHVLDINQQILSHRKAGRWTAAQTWYEIKLAENPDNIDVQIDLLTCLKESGQHGRLLSILGSTTANGRADVLLNYVEGIEKHTGVTTINRIVPYAVEASWATGRWQTMRKFISKYQGDHTENFNVSIAQALLYLQQGWTKSFVEEMKILRERVASSMTFSATSSLQTCHEPLLKCHVLTDLELIAGINNDETQHLQETLKSLNRRLEVLGSYVNDKQYVLGIRRAAMELMRPKFSDLDISALWLASARLARKVNSMHQSFNAVLHASELGDGSATIENARLLWKEGHSRKAIQTLQGAIASTSFTNGSFAEHDSSEKNLESQQSMLTARAHLLLAKWLDNAGQTHASALRQQYQNVPKSYATWEKGHYYLGRHYKKVLESEKSLKMEDQSEQYLSGETAKLVIENYIRSLNYGTKYLYQTLPRILTLWLEMGAQLDKAPEGRVSLSRELYHRRKTLLDSLHKYLNKYINRLPAYIFYTALPQLVARIAHPNPKVFMLLQEIILKVVEAHPRQALWSLFAIMTSKQATSERRTRGQQILQRLRGASKKVENGSFDLKSILRMGEKLADQLLMACNNGDFQSNRTTIASITRDLGFNHKCTPCPLVVPIEACLTATLPTLTDNVKKHKAFSRDVITIDCFLDEVLVLGSLAKPRKLIARGSNGINYGLLIKPKDDLRTDQRLMEFNGMINRSLKRDAESSRRQLYIRTYAVTPLNEECGIIEWVEGLKTLRDILLSIYRSKGVVPNYSHLATMMRDAATGDKNIKIFTEGVLGTFPPVLPQWFISQFPNPTAWFAARLRYTRSCAVMSMVGTILGLGDRHGENVLLEEGNGGIFHVDFNCLFDKGLTFAQPERVPFRLTHNMVAAMGIHGYEGPFRKCSELTLSILRQQEETLMTILEAFIYDPTLDLQRDKKRKHEVVRLNPQSVVDNIRRKVRGLLPDESIPLGVEGQVEELIKQAVNPRNLAAMYIGWCPFL
ncbi:hypothetical protein DL763_003270 [Monosporascus cannonballus]|nr:hypothetical protein DL763_003270 [Monosporascus cannonballus]